MCEEVPDFLTAGVKSKRLTALLAVRGFRFGEIRILDSTGAVTRIIPFDETGRRLVTLVALCSVPGRFA